MSLIPISRLLKTRPEKSNSVLNLSVSKVKVFKDCKMKYNFSYIKKLPAKDYEFLTFGKFLHEVLENFHKNYLEGTQDPKFQVMGRCYKAAFQNWKDKITPEQLKECKDILNIYLKQLSEQKDNAPEILSVERPFFIDIDGKILLNGYIDRVQRDSDGVLHLADYKSSKSKKYLKNDFFQLLTYAFVYCLENPEIQKIRCSYIFLKHNFESIVKDFDRAEIMEVEQVYLDWAEKINSEKLFRATPSPLCDYCSYQDICPSAYFKNNLKFGEAGW